jgi:pteridine reductase
MSGTSEHPVALVTGSAHRIGAEIARHLHAHDYRLIIHCQSSCSSAERLAGHFNSLRAGSAVVLQADLTDPDQLVDLASRASDSFGRLDLLVNNASRFFPTPMGAVTVTQWDDLVNTNLRAPFMLSQALHDSLRARRGCIVNITDVYGHRPLGGHPVYSMTKAGLIMLTQSLAMEMGPEVRVNAVSPGAIIWPDNDIDEQRKAEILERTSLGRIGEAEDIAETVLFLAQADYVTGQVLAVDGGRLVHI